MRDGAKMPLKATNFAGVVKWLRRLPSKQKVRVQFSPPAPLYYPCRDNINTSSNAPALMITATMS